jgi:hypothetical protein
MPSDTDGGFWNEMRVGKTYSPISHTRTDRTPCDSVPVVPHPPYSPDLAHCDFFLFPRLKSTLKGKRFKDVAEIQLNMTWQLQAISKQAYQMCIEKWKNCCIQSGGSYFEGDNFE